MYASNNETAAKQKGSTFYGGNIPLFTGLPIPSTFEGLTNLVKSAKLIMNFQKLATEEFHDKRLNQGWYVAPNHPMINDAKPTMQFITTPSYMPNSPVITQTGQSRLLQERSRRIANKRPGNSYYKIPLLARMGHVSLFGRGTGYGVDKFLPLPFMNEREERAVKVSWADHPKNLGTTKKLSLDPKIGMAPIRS